MKPTKMIVSAVLAILIFILGFWLGQVNGKNKGAKETESKLRPLIDLAFPRPAAEMKNLTGVIKGVYGATVDLEINNLDDYLPHVDGSPQKKEIRFVYITSNTKISSVNVNNNVQNSIKSSDLKIGNIITVYSNENIRSAKKFDAIEIQVIKS